MKISRIKFNTIRETLKLFYNKVIENGRRRLTEKKKKNRYKGRRRRIGWCGGKEEGGKKAAKCKNTNYPLFVDALHM